MGFFSRSEPLSAEFKEALSPLYRPEAVGNNEYHKGVAKLEGAQGSIRSFLRGGENLINIVPSVTNIGYDGQLILTNQRVIHYKRQIQGQIEIRDVVDIRMGAAAGGWISVHIVSRQANEFRAFKDHGPDSRGGAKYWEAIVQTYVNDPKLAKHTASLILGEASRASEPA